MKFDTTHSQLSPTRISAQAKKAQRYLLHLSQVARAKTYDAPESSLVLPTDQELFTRSVKLVKKIISRKLKVVVVIGIGGSNLGTKALYDALWGYRDALEPNRYPKMFFAETVDQEQLSALSRAVKKFKTDEVLTVLISKSGGTAETIAI